MADAYLPVMICNLPVAMFFQPGGALRQNIAAMPKGVVRVIAGATECHCIIDIKRPYFRPIITAVTS